ncbi:MAG: N-acetylmuramic acid 6-phosphate etherase [Monoglobales bacterium]
MLKTEMRNELTTHIDKMSTLEMLQIINNEDRKVIDAVNACLPQIAKAVDAVADAFNRGGRLFYIGAGTSGRLGVIDAAECPPTYGVPREQVQGIIAGGLKTMAQASENEEDNREAGINDFMERGLKKEDVVLGISVAGGAAYVIGALEKAKEIGCTTIGLTGNEGSKISQIADISIAPDTGAEVITGSTRMKAGTAQKLILNMISTCSMIKTGKVYENLMINLRPVNEKLTDRMVRIVVEILGYDYDRAKAKLEEYDWNIRKLVEGEKQ